MYERSWFYTSHPRIWFCLIKLQLLRVRAEEASRGFSSVALAFLVTKSQWHTMSGQSTSTWDPCTVARPPQELSW